MKRFRVIEFSALGNFELEEKLNKEIKTDEKIIDFSIRQNPNPYGGLLVRVILENPS